MKGLIGYLMDKIAKKCNDINAMYKEVDWDEPIPIAKVALITKWIPLILFYLLMPPQLTIFFTFAILLILWVNYSVKCQEKDGKSGENTEFIGTGLQLQLIVIFGE